MPTTRKAISLTTDSVATASIMPSWCSVASAWRVPNRMAKTAIAKATNRATSPTRPVAAPVGGPMARCWIIVSTEIETAFSCRAM